MGETGFIDFMNEIDGSGGDYLKQPAGGSRMPATAETVTQRLHYVKQDGQQVFKYAVRKMYETSRDLLARNNFQGSDVAMFIPHQANKRIILAATDRLGMDAGPGDDQYRSLRQHDGGNDSAGHAGRHERRQAEERRPGLVRRGGRGLYGWRESVEMADVASFDIFLSFSRRIIVRSKE